VGWVSGIGQAAIGLGGGMAASRNSSLAPKNQGQGIASGISAQREFFNTLGYKATFLTPLC
jgi:hypothetical protein